MTEYKFIYVLENEELPSEKYFMAHDLDEANTEFQYVCDKQNIRTKKCSVERWNRWLDVWEPV